MNKDLAKKWVDALRGGKYQQGRHQLRKPEQNEYCCLGVLCDISGLGKWDNDDPAVFVDDNGHESYVTINRALLEKLGLNEDISITLAGMNDIWGQDFSQIADKIEEMLLK